MSLLKSINLVITKYNSLAIRIIPKLVVKYMAKQRRETLTLELKAEAFNHISRLMSTMTYIDNVKITRDAADLVNELINNTHTRIRESKVVMCRKRMNSHHCEACISKNRTNKMLFCKYVCAINNMKNNATPDTGINAYKYLVLQNQTSKYGKEDLLDIYKRSKD